MKLSWGIIGLGQLANEWIAPAIRASNNGQLVACADSIVERADQFGSFHGIDHVYYSYEKLIEDTQVEAVYVATPNALHHAIVLAAARARKHVLCQKPMALTAREAEEMLTVCDGAGITLRIGLHLRFQRILQASSDYIRNGSIGTVREVSVQRYAPIHEAKMSGWRHELALAGAGSLADRVYIMTKGRVVYEGLPDELAGDDRTKEEQLGIGGDQGQDFMAGQP